MRALPRGGDDDARRGRVRLAVLQCVLDEAREDAVQCLAVPAHGWQIAELHLRSRVSNLRVQGCEDILEHLAQRDARLRCCFGCHTPAREGSGERLRARNKMGVMEALPTLASFELPKALIESESGALAERMKADLKARGMDVRNIPVPAEAFREQAEKRPARDLGLRDEGGRDQRAEHGNVEIRGMVRDEEHRRRCRHGAVHAHPEAEQLHQQIGRAHV